MALPDTEDAADQGVGDAGDPEHLPGRRAEHDDQADDDLAVLDPATVTDLATYGPWQYAEGMRHVLVAGEIVLRDGEMTGARPGRLLRRVPAGG